MKGIKSLINESILHFSKYVKLIHRWSRRCNVSTMTSIFLPERTSVSCFQPVSREDSQGRRYGKRVDQREPQTSLAAASRLIKLKRGHERETEMMVLVVV